MNFGTFASRALFKRLLSAKARRAPRGVLLEDLWPDAPQGEKYLNDAANKLRHVLSSEQGSLLTTFGTHSASGYALPDQSLLWVDADEALALLKDAEAVERTSAQRLRLLEQAAQLFDRGGYLEEEAGLWSHSRRATLEHLAYRCHLWLAEAYNTQGRVGQAEICYRHLLEDDPADEDVVCRLITLLHEQGMDHEALQWYTKSKQIAQQMGQPFSTRIEALVAHCSHQPRHVENILLTNGKTSRSFLHATPPRNGDQAWGLQKPVARSLHALTDTSSLPLLMLTESEVLAHLSNALSSDGNIGARHLTYCEQQTRLYWRVREETLLPAHILYPSVVKHMHESSLFLNSSLSPALRLSLCETMCQIVLLAGVLLYDMGLYEKARQHTIK